MTTANDTSRPHDDNVLVRTWHKLWIEADPTGLEALVYDPYVRHSCHGDTVSMSPADYGSHIARVTGHLRGTEIDIAHLVEVDDMIHARFTLRGMSLTTGTPVSVAWLGHYRVEGGKLAESWTLRETDAAW